MKKNKKADSVTGFDFNTHLVAFVEQLNNIIAPATERLGLPFETHGAREHFMNALTYDLIQFQNKNFRVFEDVKTEVILGFESLKTREAAEELLWDLSRLDEQYRVTNQLIECRDKEGGIFAKIANNISY